MKSTRSIIITIVNWLNSMCHVDFGVYEMFNKYNTDDTSHLETDLAVIYQLQS